jgi:hypothetical protein
MKKLLFIALLTSVIQFNAIAQVNPHAIGLRLGGGGYGQGAELSYQKGIGGSNRLELDLGWRFRKYDDNGVGNDYSHIVFSGIYHWVWNITDGLNWYVGPGGQLGMWNYKSDFYDDGFTLAIGGQIGLEYDFNGLGAPILLSLDSRPMWGLVGPGNGFGYGGALGIRYTF